MNYLAITVLAQPEVFLLLNKTVFYHCDEVTAKYGEIHFESTVCWNCFEIKYRQMALEIQY